MTSSDAPRPGGFVRDDSGAPGPEDLSPASHPSLAASDRPAVGPEAIGAGPSHEPDPIRRFFRMLGPGLITGASDDDPSGIGTYASAGAAFGYATLWTAPVSSPLMAAVQFTCAKVGLVTGRGLAGVVRRHYPRPALLGGRGPGHCQYDQRRCRHRNHRQDPRVIGSRRHAGSLEALRVTGPEAVAS